MQDCVPEIKHHEIENLTLRSDAVICPRCESPITQIADDDNMVCMYCGHYFDREQPSGNTDNNS